MRFPGFGFGEPAAAELLGGDAGHVGLDVEEWGAIEHVEAADVEFGSVAAQEFDDGESDGIGAAGRAGGEDPVRAVVGGRGTEELVALGSVEGPDYEEVREAFNVRKARLEFGENIKDAFDVVLDAEAFRNGFGVSVRTSHMADGAGCEHGVGRSVQRDEERPMLSAAI